jgi:hypothetical protein
MSTAQERMAALDLAIKAHAAAHPDGVLFNKPSDFIDDAKEYEKYITGAYSLGGPPEKEPKVVTRIEVVDGHEIERRETQEQLPVEDEPMSPCGRCGVAFHDHYGEKGAKLDHHYESPKGALPRTSGTVSAG